jgi:hypothetical protein
MRRPLAVAAFLLTFPLATAGHARRAGAILPCATADVARVAA